MANIHVLDKAVAELIAAGEVVERPASIVKELLENALDAGASAITVEIRGGGVQYIRIADNGCGIEREDIPRAFLRHATSKVRTQQDLNSIHTLGFRGEALASIAAMCRVELTTKTAGATEGTTCRVQGGEMLDSFPVGCPTGTTITVQDVFFNTPARMKFLKKDVSEGNSVAQVVDKCALSHPEVAFRFIRDNQTRLHTSGGGDLLAVIRAIYGKELADAMLPVDYTADGRIRVSGYVSSPGAAKPSRTYQNFFINGRYVRTRTAGAALEEAMKNKLMSGRFPACVLNLEIDAETVDVNVHPAKIEVRFAAEKPVFHAVYFAVKSALAALDGPLSAPAAPAESTAAHALAAGGVRARPEPVQQRMSAQEFRMVFGGEEEPAAFSRPAALHSSRLDIRVEDGETPPSSAYSAKNPPADSATLVAETPAGPGSGRPPAAPEEPPAPPAAIRQIGEVFGTYILLEQGDDLLLVDKHAAHERILYERLKQTVAYGNRQLLLTPQTVTLSKEEYDALTGDLERVAALGFGVEDFGDGTVLVREIPIELGQKDIALLLGEIAARLQKGNRDITPETLDRLYYSIACRSALQAHDKNNPAELAEIVRKLQQHPAITHCPHGRPVVVRLTRREVEKMFGRLG